MRDAHARLIEQGVTAGVREIVADSWLRSVAAGIKADTSEPPITLDRSVLRQYRDEHPLAQIFPLLADVLGQAAQECDAVMAVADEQGQLLWVSGSTGVLRRAEAISFVEGAQWDEAHAGTNAPGTALRLDSPVTIRAAEHFVRPVQRWSCAAAPIHDRRGRVTGAVIVFHDVGVARAMSLKMSYLAEHDFLTELPNRMLLNDRLTQAMTLAHRHRKSLAVLFLDVDHFKHINDSLGHAIGDQLLRSIARRLVACVRESDTVSRQGGDEFVVLLSEVAHAEDAAYTADKVIAAVRRLHHLDHQDLQITMSVGIAVYPADGTDAETLLKNADLALLHAKTQGRSNHQFFEPEMSARASA